MADAGTCPSCGKATVTTRAGRLCPYCYWTEKPADTAGPEADTAHTHNWQRGYGQTPWCHDCGLDENDVRIAELVALLDEFDRYASAGAGAGDYNGSPFQDRVHDALGHKG